MKFLTGFVAISAAISQALAVALTNSGYDITEGEPFTLTWSDAEGDVTLLLKDGPSNNLGTVATIACKSRLRKMFPNVARNLLLMRSVLTQLASRVPRSHGLPPASRAAPTPSRLRTNLELPTTRPSSPTLVLLPQLLPPPVAALALALRQELPPSAALVLLPRPPRRLLVPLHHPQAPPRPALPP